MTRLFDKVIVRKPSKSLGSCVSPYVSRFPVDFPKALDQYRELIKILKSEGIEIIELEPLDKYPDSVFVQDEAVIGNRSKRALLSYFGEPSRRGEEEPLLDLLRSEGFAVERIRPPGTLEGGDVVVTDRGVVFVGKTVRTNEEGINQFIKFFASEDIRFVVVPSDRFIHISAGVRYLEDNYIVLASGTADPKYFEGFKIITLRENLSPVKAESGARAYLLYIGERKVILPPGNDRFAEELKKYGFEAIFLDFTEFWKCNGSYMCLIQPFYNFL